MTEPLVDIRNLSVHLALGRRETALVEDVSFSVARGEVALAPRIAALLVGRMQRPAVPTLSPRETEVLALVSQGLSNPAIASRLFLGEATVKTHLLHVFEKLGVSDRTRAVTRAMELGLL